MELNKEPRKFLGIVILPKSLVEYWLNSHFIAIMTFSYPNLSVKTVFDKFNDFWLIWSENVLSSTNFVNRFRQPLPTRGNRFRFRFHSKSTASASRSAEISTPGNCYRNFFFRRKSTWPAKTIFFKQYSVFHHNLQPWQWALRLLFWGWD